MISMKNCRKLGISLPKDIEDAVRERAKAENRSFSNMTAVLLAECLESKKKKAA